jgi:type I restriction enzyme S subunit
MKHNWTYKKLNEVCEKASSNIALNKIENNIGEYPLYGASGLVKHIDFYHKDKPYIGIIKDGAGVGRVGKYPAKSSLVGTMQYIHPNEEICHIDYLYFALQSLHLNESVTGATIPHIYFKDYGKLSIPIPSLEEQQAIVRELDGINRLIDLQEEQLREYDRLAQSLFYSTFGDPATNPKGWEVKKLGEILSYIKNGANIKQTRGAGGLPITRIETLSGGVFNRDRLGYADITDLSKYANFYLETGDLLMSHINSKTYIGRTVMYEKEGDETIIHGMNLLRLKVVRDIVNPVYVCYYCKTDHFKGDIAKIRKDAVNQSSICISDIVRISLPLPPLALQQSFAAQIEAIEQQKALIRRSLDDTRTLLAARMQYYFE